MDENAIGLLQELRPLIKQRWEALLRAEPSVSPLSNPDALLYLMDETLDQVGEAMHTRSAKTWLRRHRTVMTPLSEHCSCGKNPLLAYYGTGRVALSAAAADRLGPALDDVLRLFHGLAQQDVEALCGVCCQRVAGCCPPAATAPEAARHDALLSG